MEDTPDRAFSNYQSIHEHSGAATGVTGSSGALAEELKVALAIAREAGETLLTYFVPERMQTKAKGDRDVVTAADTAAEALVRRRLTEEFPKDGIVGEEGTDVPATGDRHWCLDPLDGTLNYSRTLPIWCVSLALFEGDTPVLGVIHDPTRDETFAAAVGAGACCNGSRLHTTGAAALGDACVHLTVDFHDGSMQEGLEDLAHIAPKVLRTRNLGSAALALAYVAAGRLDAMLHRFANPWDYGAGAVLVAEAGGTVTNMRGEPYRLQDSAMLAAANEPLHRALLDLVRNEQPRG